MNSGTSRTSPAGVRAASGCSDRARFPPGSTGAGTVGSCKDRPETCSDAKLAAAHVDVAQVERELHGMRRGDKKMLAEVVDGAERDVPRPEVEEQLRWYSIAPTEEEEERIERGETVTFLVGAVTPTA